MRIQPNNPEQTAPEATAALKTAERISWLMDTAIRIPGTNISIGLDPLLGLLPVAGDTVSFGISVYMILSAAKHGASPLLLARMLGNVLLDTLVGYIPMVGDLFDFAFKANKRNLGLIRKYHAANPTAANRPNVLSVILALTALASIGFLMVKGWERFMVWASSF